MYKVVRLVDGKKLSAIVSGNPLSKFIREYSTEKPVDIGFCFRTLEAAKLWKRALYGNNFEIWKVNVSKSREVPVVVDWWRDDDMEKYATWIESGEYKTLVGEWEFRETILFPVPCDTYYCYDILLLEKIDV
jgi:hypothetical protein